MAASFCDDMTVTGPKTIARLAEQNPLVTALVLSAMIHLASSEAGNWASSSAGGNIIRPGSRI
jgi:hypothetical protein